MFHTAKDLIENYSTGTNRIVKLWMGPKLMIFLGDHKHIEAILSSPDAVDKDPLYNIIGLTGNGIFVRNGIEWKDLRKPLNKVLNKKLIESNIDTFHNTALKFCKVIHKYSCTGQKFDVKSYTTNYFLDTLAVSNFGHEINELENNRYNISNVLKTSLEITMQMMAKPQYNISLTLTELTKMGRKLNNYSKFYWNFTNELLQGRIERRKHMDENDGIEFYSDFLLKKAEENKLTQDERGRLVTDFVIAGFDSSAVITSYAFLMLAMFPEYQEALYQEQVDILGENLDESLKWEHLSQMTYLSRVIKEVMRLYCPLAILRQLSKNVKLDEEYTLPKGSTAYLMFYSLHRDPKYWSHPQEFYPDHFLPEEVAKRPKGTYLPFSWGPRSCPGAQLATITMKTLISVAIRKYKFETDMKYENLEHKYSLFLESNQGYIVQIKERT
ncbi:cytochrome P450 4C1-like isoform X2 [Rhodnius prolixus]